MIRARVLSTRTVRPLKLIRRVRGGSQACILLCDDGYFYVTKFVGNPQGPNVLANEWLGTSLARSAGLPVANSVVVKISQGFLERNQEIVFCFSDRSTRPEAGLHFGSRMVREKPGNTPVMQYVPTSQMEQVKNTETFLGIAVFDLLTEMDDLRQAVFLRHPHDRSISATFIDFGHLLQGPCWESFRILQAINHSSLAYCPTLWQDKKVKHWVRRFQKTIPRAFALAAAEIPETWYTGDIIKKQTRLLERLHFLPDLIASIEHTHPELAGASGHTSLVNKGFV